MTTEVLVEYKLLSFYVRYLETTQETYEKGHVQRMRAEHVNTA